jgi:hypothetical protein
MQNMPIHISGVILISVLLLQSGCRNQGPMKTQARTVQSAPKIAFEKTEYDFGEVSTRKKYTGQFTFTNTGGEPLKITEVKKCCGVVAELADEKTEYMPGETGVLNVTYTSGSVAGTLKRQLHVVSNDAANPDTTLTIQAKVAPKIACTPQRLEIPVRGENAGCPPITIRSLDGKAFSIRAFRSPNGALTAEFDPNVKATEFVLHPEFHPDKMRGIPVGLVNIELTHPDTDRITISYQPIPDFRITPRTLMVLNAQSQKPVIRNIDIRSNYNEDFEIESVTSKNDSLKVLNEEKTDNGYRLEIEAVPPAPGEKQIYNDTLYVKLRDGKTLEVRFYVRYAEQASPAQIQAKLNHSNEN